MTASQTQTTPETAPAAWQHRRHLALLLLVAAVWAVEMFLVQEWTLRPDMPLGLDRAIAHRAIRLSFDFTAVLVVVALVPRFWLYGMFVASAVLSSVLLVYNDYFGRPLSFWTIAYQSGEGLAVADAWWAFLDWNIILPLAAAVGVKVVLRQRAARYPANPDWVRAAAVGAGFSYVGGMVLMVAFAEPLSYLRTWQSLGYTGSMYGYLACWAGEAWYLPQDALLEQAVDAAEQKSDRLTPVETPVSLGNRVAIIQAESLDYQIVDFTVDGRRVMPFLNRLRHESMYYKVRPVHLSGSSDADFVTLTGLMPVGLVAPFKVAGFPYENTLPQLAREHGYRSMFFHGNKGTFFSRRSAVRQMDFDAVYFERELLAAGLRPSKIGVADDALLPLAARLMNEAEGPTLQFLITLTTHAPYDYLPDHARLMYPRPDLTQRYYNNMHYLDAALRRYVEAVPEGTTVVIYGDHDSSVIYGDKPLDRRHPEFVPVFIYRKGENLADTQRTAGTRLATSGRLTMLDVVTFLRHRLAARSAADNAASRAKLTGHADAAGRQKDAG